MGAVLGTAGKHLGIDASTTFIQQQSCRSWFRRAKQRSSLIGPCATSTAAVILLLAVVLPGCAQPKVKNARIIPTYVCEGESVRPVAKWEYSGPKGKVRIYTASWDRLCEAGARSELCGPFERPLTQDDVPLRWKAFRKGDEKDRGRAQYTVLSGPTDSEEFEGVYEWGEPVNEEVVTKRPTYDEEGRVSGMEEVRETVSVQYCDHVRWNLDPSWFTSRVITKSAKYVSGATQISLEGPGVTGAQTMNVHNTVVGNDAHPGGEWKGSFTPRLRRTANDTEYSPVFELQLKLACLED